MNAAHVLGRAGRIGRIAPGYEADLVLLDAPDWRYLAYHLGGDLVSTVIKDGQPVWSRAETGGIIASMPSRKQRRRREKLERHEYEYVVETEEGEVPVERLRDLECADDEPRAGRRPGAEPALVDRRGRPDPEADVPERPAPRPRSSGRFSSSSSTSPTGTT